MTKVILSIWMGENTEESRSKPFAICLMRTGGDQKFLCVEKEDGNQVGFFQPTQKIL